MSKSAPKEALANLDRAYKNFIRGIKNHENVGMPKFKKKGIHDSFRLTGAVGIEGKMVALPRIGLVRIKESVIKLNGRILSATISRDADRWFCSLCVEVDKPEPVPVNGDIIGIDLGLNSFAVISNGDEYTNIESPKPLKKRLVKLQRLGRQQSRKLKNSHNRKKANLRLARCYRKVKNTRKDFLNKLTTSLAKTKSVIVIEDLAVKNMVRNRHLARSISDVGWGEFRRQLIYKTVWYGSKLIIVPRFEPSSKTCHACGAINDKLQLSDRSWVCMNCGTLHDRDENASDNIRNYGLKTLTTEGSSGSNACGVGVIPQVIEVVHNEAGSKHLLGVQGL